MSLSCKLKCTLVCSAFKPWFFMSSFNCRNPWIFSGRNVIQNNVYSPPCQRAILHKPLLSCVVSNIWKSKTCKAGKHFCACFGTCNYQEVEGQADFCLHLLFISHNCFDLLSIIFFCLSSFIITLHTCHPIIKIIPQSNSCSK